MQKLLLHLLHCAASHFPVQCTKLLALSLDIIFTTCGSASTVNSTQTLSCLPSLDSATLLLQEAVQHIPAMLDSLAVCARFPQDSCNFALTAADATEAVAAEEETANMLEKRQELFTLFKNTAKLVPEQAYAFVGKQLQGAVSSSKAEWQVGAFCAPMQLSYAAL